MDAYPGYTGMQVRVSTFARVCALKQDVWLHVTVRLPTFAGDMYAVVTFVPVQLAVAKTVAANSYPHVTFIHSALLYGHCVHCCPLAVEQVTFLFRHESIPLQSTLHSLQLVTAVFDRQSGCVSTNVRCVQLMLPVVHTRVRERVPADQAVHEVK